MGEKKRGRTVHILCVLEPGARQKGKAKTVIHKYKGEAREQKVFVIRVHK